MPESSNIEERISKLNKEILLLSWDIPLIVNDKLKAAKEDKLLKLKQELQKLIKERGDKTE